MNHFGNGEGGTEMIPGDVNCSDRGVGSSGSKGAGEGRWRGAQGGGQVLMYLDDDELVDD